MKYWFVPECLYLLFDGIGDILNGLINRVGDGDDGGKLRCFELNISRVKIYDCFDGAFLEFLYFLLYLLQTLRLLLYLGLILRKV